MSVAIHASAVDARRRVGETIAAAELERRATDVRDRVAATIRPPAERGRRSLAERGRSFAARRPNLARPTVLRRPEKTDKEEPGMLTFARRALGLLFGGLTLTMIVGAIAAISMRGKLVATETTDPEADEIVAVAIFGPLAFRSRARAFRGGTLDCWYGGGALDLREATLDPTGAHLRVRAVFGGGQILVPETWRVTTTARGLGGMTDGRPTADRPIDAPELTIDGTLLFGGFAILSEMPAEAASWMDRMEAARA